MRITSVETIRDPHHPMIVWVLLHTDEGITGYGETAGLPGAVARVVHDLFAGMLVGEDPRQVESLWNRGFRAVSYRGAGGAEMRALSAVDFALWDILGKVADLPVYALLGGASRQDIPIYNTCGNYGEIRDRDAFLEEPAALALDLLEQGITMMKIWPFDDLAQSSGGQHISAADLEKGSRPFDEIRAAVGQQMEIAMEGHCLWNLPSAVRIARALEPYAPIWIEDLIWPDNIDALAQLRRSTSTPLIASERLLTRFRFAELLDQRAADLVMPDLAWSGGISECLKIAALASARQLPVAPHNCGGPLTHVATAHFCAHIANLTAMETFRAFYLGYFADVVTEPLMPEGGRLPLPPGPGLGSELRRDFLAREDLIREISTDSLAEPRGLTEGDPWRTQRF